VTSLAFDVCVPVSHPALAGHFPGKPTVPGVVLLDHVLASLHAALARRVRRIEHVRFRLAPEPGEVVQVRCDVQDAKASLKVTAVRNGTVLLLASGSLMLLPGEDVVA
jgi:3-hydroxymyristoyl/3-hydroxydecanoyl-(acyl carrier protein) dehydratase